MSVSDVLHPDGSDYDPFLQAEVGEDRTGAAVTVLSALARLGLEPWSEARELASLDRDAARTRMKTHLAAISDIPSLGPTSDSVAAKLVALLPKTVSRRVSDIPAAMNYSGPRIPVYWVLMALIAALVLARFYYLAHAG